MIDKKILKILNTETKDLKGEANCPANSQFKHYIGTGMSAQCGQCGGYYKCPKPYTNKQKAKALESLLKEYAMEIIGEDEVDDSDPESFPELGNDHEYIRNQLRAEQREKLLTEDKK